MQVSASRAICWPRVWKPRSPIESVRAWTLLLPLHLTSNRTEFLTLYISNVALFPVVVEEPSAVMTALCQALADVPSLWELWRTAADGAHAADDMPDTYQAWRRATGVAAAPAGRGDVPEVTP